MSVLLCGLAIIPPYQGAEHERIPMNNANGPTAKGFVLTGKLVFGGSASYVAVLSRLLIAFTLR
jgi:hypothetical protein